MSRTGDKRRGSADSSGGDMRIGRVDLSALVARCRADLARSTTARHIDWRIGDLPAVQGDEAMLEQVFATLLGMAVMYTRLRARAEIDISARVSDDGLLTVCVRDNGVGFDPANAGRRPGGMERADPGAGKTSGGIATDLAAVRRIVARHGGTTWVEGHPGEDASFYLTLPSGPTAPQHAEPGTPERREAAPEPVADAITVAWGEIFATLTPIVGQRGAAALYQRSLYLAARLHPWLTGVQEGLPAPVDLRLLGSALAQQSSEEAAAGGLAHLQIFRQLLTTLIGAALTARLLDAVWIETLNHPTGQ